MEVKYPVWVDEEGNKWTYEPCWEQCEFGWDGSQDFTSEPPENLCTEPVEFVAWKNGRQNKGLCREHFEKVKSRCTVRFEDF